MCGIAALFSASPRTDLSDLVRQMSDTVRYRGPDDEGYAVFPQGAAAGTAALGHRRLSIVDLSPGGHQPMSSPDGKRWIVYNGEIYNHIELRAELEKAGVRFSTRSDTEVLLAAFKQWGERALERLNGMFVLVLVDWERGRVLAARDRFGVKPLYYWTSPEGLVAFASEIKQFTVLPGWRARVNGPRAWDFLQRGLLDHTGETLFAGVRQLSGGESAEFPLNELRVQPRRWYALTPRQVDGSGTDAYRAMLEDAVRLRLRADVPVGSCLSGGLDSSAIVCLANRQLREAGAQVMQKTFSARSSDARYDEGRFIDAVVRGTGVANAQVQPRPDALFSELPNLAWHQDEPFGSTSIFAQWHVFRLAAEAGVKVMLDGQGADEQLAGYYGFFRARLAGLARRGAYFSALKDLLGMGRHHRHAMREALRRSAAADCVDAARLGADTVVPSKRASSVRELSEQQLLHTSLPMLLHWEDRDSMAHSVEARLPFLDYRVVEIALGLPEEAKLAGGVTKRVLREAMRGVLPEEIRTRMDKIGFATAEEQWLRERPEEFRSALRQAIDAAAGVLRPQAASRLLDDIIAGRQPFSYLPWRMISFGAWMRRFEVSLQ
jgi:asparagine synthase (glutamine-hydrolysing)